MRWLDGITDSMDMKLRETPGDGEGQGSLACCSPWGHRESDTTGQLNNMGLWDKEENSVVLLDSKARYTIGLLC